MTTGLIMRVNVRTTTTTTTTSWKIGKRFKYVESEYRDDAYQETFDLILRKKSGVVMGRGVLNRRADKEHLGIEGCVDCVSQLRWRLSPWQATGNY